MVKRGSSYLRHALYLDTSMASIFRICSQEERPREALLCGNRSRNEENDTNYFPCIKDRKGVCRIIGLKF